MSVKPIDPLLIDKPGHCECLLGNEAIVRGAVESGVVFAAGYPGTPSSEITDSFARLAPQTEIRFEYSVNEKVALEMAFAASIAGARAICAMKHLGLMYAGDPLSTIPYVGTVGGLVIVSAGDPSCRTSPNEQDQRLLAPMLHLPMLDPSTPQMAYAMTRFAFELSEKSQLPVILRPTTRVCHSREVVCYGEIHPPRVTGFVRNPERFVPIPQHARKLRQALTERVETARQMIAESEFFLTEGKGPLAVLASGAPAATCHDVLDEAGLLERVKRITVGGVYPLPKQPLIESLGDVQKVLVVEELSPYLEDALSALCAAEGLQVQVMGKRTGHFPIEFEYSPEQINRALHEALGLGPAPALSRAAADVPLRPPTLCPGCPHRPALFSIRNVFGEDGLIFNDIGCYTLGAGPPINTADGLLCMGAGFTLAAGVSRVTGKRTVGILGDSTFFHSGMPALLNAVKENVNMVAVILDNQVTAMTGFQESPGVEFADDEISRTVDIEEAVHALGVRHVETFDPYDLPVAIAALERARDARGVSVVIVRRACPSFVAKKTHRPYKIATYEIDQAACHTCGREAEGRRCHTCISLNYERHMARGRAMETGQRIEPVPPTSPCSARCPVDLCVQGYVGHIAAGQYKEAFDIIMEQLPLPDSVCRVCHYPCEAACVREGIDEAVSIKALKRFALDWAAAHGVAYEPERDAASGKKVAVVGAGPAGLAAAHDLWLRGFDVTLFERDEKPGGLLRSGIPDYRLPPDAVDRDVDRLLRLGIRFEGGRVLGEDLQLEALLSDGYDAVFVGIGAHMGVDLKLEGSDRPGAPVVLDALTFLKQVKLDLQQGPLGKVVVIGGGNAAIDAARTALRLGADAVTIVYRRGREEMPAIDEEIDAAQREGIAILARMQPSALGPEGLMVVRTEPGEPDASGRCRPVVVEDSEHLIFADTVIAAVGQLPDQKLANNLDVPLGCAADRTLVVDPVTGTTSHPKIFAGGDAVAGPRTVIHAIAAGRRAAWGIDRELRGSAKADQRPPPPLMHDGRQVAVPVMERADRTPRQPSPELDSDERVQSFSEVVGPLAEDAARAEASRCLVCGLCGNCRICLDLFGCPAFYVEGDRIHIDPVLCMGCGVCAEICPNGAIRKVDEARVVQSDEPPAGPAEAFDEEPR